MNVGTNRDWAASSGGVGSMQTAAGPNVVDTLEMGETELQEIYDLPPLSSYASACRFWWKVSMWPLMFILLNGVVLISLFESEEEYFEEYYYDFRKRHAHYVRNLVVVAVMSFIDSIVLYRSAVFMNKEVGLLKARETENEATATSSSTTPHLMHHVHAQVSLKMDMFLSRGQRKPDVSLFVNLLYQATFLALASSLVCFALWGFLGSSNATRMCSGDRYTYEADNTPPIDGVPDDLQEWVKNTEGYGYGRRPPFTYAHMADGSTYFVGRNVQNASTSATNDDDDSFSDSVSSDYALKLIVTGHDGSIRSFSNVNEPRWLTIVSGENALAAEEFCCWYYTPSLPRVPSQLSFLCVAASEDISHGFRNVTVGAVNSRTRDVRPLSMKAHSGELWILVRVVNNHVRRTQRGYYAESHQTEIYKLYPETMQISSIANVTHNDEDFNPFRVTDKCSRWTATIGSAVGAAVLGPASFWMLKVRKMSAGVVPVCVGLIKLIGLLSEDLAKGIAYLTAVAVTIALFGKVPAWMGHDILPWALYSTLGALFAISPGHVERIGVMILFVMIGLILDHPVSQLVGWLGGIATLFIGIFSFSSKHGKLENLVIIPIGIVVSCGFVSMGYNLTRYRAYLVYHSRRLWMLTSTAMSNASTHRENVAGQQPRGDDMTQGLLS